MSMTIDWSVEGGVGWITINNPARKNALTVAMRQAMAEQLEAAAFDENVRAIVIKGAGDTFCSGADLEQFGPETPLQSRRRLLRGGHRMIRALYNLEKPVISLVRGYAIGLGWSLPLASDVVIAADTAQFALPHLRSALVADGGAVYFIARQIGMYRAKEIVLSSRFVGALEAFSLGLVSKVVPEAELDAEVTRMAEQLAAAPTFSFGMVKKLFSAALSPSIEEFLQQESLMTPQLRHTEDFHEGIAAFREKRKPSYKGR